MSHWNYRVLAHIDRKLELSEANEIILIVHRVYYDSDGVAKSYSEQGSTLLGNCIEDINETLKSIRKCLDLPVLWAGDKFPQHFKKQEVID